MYILLSDIDVISISVAQGMLKTFFKHIYVYSASKDDLKKAAKALKEKTPAAMNTMLNKQSQEEAVGKRKERKKMIGKSIPPTTPGN